MDTKQTIVKGERFVAAKATRACNGCAFQNDTDTSRCEAAGDCTGIVWVRKEDRDMNTMLHGKPFPDSSAKQVGGNHYQQGGSNMQPWDIARAWNLNGWEMNILKYLLRHRFKNKQQDIEKLIHYAEYLRDNYEELYESE